MKYYMRNRGFSIVELLVAATIFALIVMAVYSFYIMGQRSYEVGSQSTDLQQRVRFVQDKLTRDLRLVGYDVHRDMNDDGEPDRPGEQIEGAWKHAISIRANFDFETQSPHGLEDPTTGYMANSDDLAVTTGNDEIVTYVLEKENNGASDTATLKLDLSKPRDMTEETKQIDNIALSASLDNPPYKLVKYTFKDNDKGDPTATTVADNIRELEFKYYDSSGEEIEPNTTYDGTSIPATGIGGGDDLDGISDEGRKLRDKIAKIEVRVRGMTGEPDMKWVNDTSKNPRAKYDDSIVPHHRLFQLSSVIRPPNMNKMLKPEMNMTAPDSPDIVHIHGGHHGIMVMDWKYNSDTAVNEQGIVKFYAELIEGSAANGTPLEIWEGKPWNIAGTGFYRINTATHFNTDITPGQDYTVRVWAEDLSGNRSEDFSAPASAVVEENTTTPKAPSGITSTATDGSVDNYTNADLKLSIVPNITTLDWDHPVSENTTKVSCDFQDDKKYRDGKGYRIYRTRAVDDSGNSLEITDTNAGTDDEDPGSITQTNSTLWPSTPGTDDPIAEESSLSSPSFKDTDAYPCDLYVYLVRAADSDPTKSISTVGVSDAAPTDADGNPEGVLGYTVIDKTAVPDKVTGLVVNATDSTDGYYDLEFEWNETTVQTATGVYKINDYVIKEYACGDTISCTNPDVDLTGVDPVAGTTVKDATSFDWEDHICAPANNTTCSSGDKDTRFIYTVTPLNPCDFFTDTSDSESKARSAPCTFGGNDNADVWIQDCGDPTKVCISNFDRNSSNVESTVRIIDSNGNELCSDSDGSLGSGSCGQFYIAHDNCTPDNYDGDYDIFATVEDGEGCMATASSTCSKEAACCIDTPSTPEFCVDNTTGYVDMDIYNLCQTNITVSQVEIDWSWTCNGNTKIDKILWDGEEVWNGSSNSNTTLTLADSNGNHPALDKDTTASNSLPIKFVFEDDWSGCTGSGSDFYVKFSYERGDSGNTSTCTFSVDPIKDCK